MFQRLIKKRDFWIVLALFLSAGFFRIFFLDLIEFKADEAFTIYEMENFFSSPYLMQVGPISSTKVYNPPLYNYLMIVLSSVSREPQFISFLIALINSICIPLFYLVVKKFYPAKIALIASVLMALSPLSILYSRKIWNTNLLMPFCLAYFYFLHQIALKNDKKAYFGLFLSLILASQIHLSSFFLTLAILGTLFILKKKINIKTTLLGVIIALIPVISYLYRQVTSNPICIDCQAILNYQSSNLSFDPGNFIRQFQIIGGIYFWDSLGTDYNLFLSNYPIIKFLNFVFTLEYLIPLIGIFLLIKYKSKYLFIPLILGLMATILFLTRTPSYIYHTIVASPLIFVFYALSLENLEKFFKSKKIVLLIFLIILISNIIFEIFFYKFLSEKKTIQGYYGPIFKITKEFVENKLAPYKDLPNFERIKIYGYVFSQYPDFEEQISKYLK